MLKSLAKSRLLIGFFITKFHLHIHIFALGILSKSHFSFMSCSSVPIIAFPIILIDHPYTYNEIFKVCD